MTPLLISCPKRQVPVSTGSTVVERSNATLTTTEPPGRYIPVLEACLIKLYPDGPDVGRRYSLGAEPIVIGRSEGCAIRNPDTSVSRCHARIVRGHDGQFLVSDLGSTNGTFVNNSACIERFLCDGDHLRVGNCIYRFLEGRNIESDYREEIYRLTIEDALTEAKNRRYFVEFLEREAARAILHKRSLAISLIDIDHLKEVNDSLGYLVGDMAMRELCHRVRSVIRKDELLARYGGEEFAILLPEADADTARVTAEKIRLSVQKKPFNFQRQSFPLTVSIGVAVLPSSESPGVEVLLSQAEANLCRAKQAGRNRVVVS